MIFTLNGQKVSEIHWTPPTERVDGSIYGDADHAGYELGVQGASGITPWVSVPAAYSVTSWPLDQLNITAEGDHAVVLRTVDTGGRVSEWSSPTVFTVAIAAPNAPADLSVS